MRNDSSSNSNYKTAQINLCPFRLQNAATALTLNPQIPNLSSTEPTILLSQLLVFPPKFLFVIFETLSVSVSFPFTISLKIVRPFL